MKVLLSGALEPAAAASWSLALQQALPEFTWLDDAALRRQPDLRRTVEVAVVANPPPGSLQDLPALRLIHSLWAGVEGLLADTTLPPAVPLARMVDPAMNAAMAQTALWAVLALHRGFFRYARQQAAGRWQALPQRRADEVRVAVLGQGQMGRTVTAVLRQQGYDVQGWRSGGAPLAAALADAEIVVNLLPLTPATRGLLDARCFAALPHGAGLVNLARGGHVVEADLLAALGPEGRLGHAVLDVFAAEPLPPGHAFWHHPRVTVLPHAAALTDPRSAAAVVAQNLRALRDGQALQHLVSRERGY